VRVLLPAAKPQPARTARRHAPAQLAEQSGRLRNWRRGGGARARLPRGGRGSPQVQQRAREGEQLALPPRELSKCVRALRGRTVRNAPRRACELLVVVSFVVVV